MHNILEINLYKDGFNNFGINCVDEALAYACGYYEYDNYFKYCLMYGVYINWANIFFPENQNKILNKIGLTVNSIEIRGTKELHDIVRSKIDKFTPICLVIDYYHLFYNNEFYKRLHTPHGIVISGYDIDRSLLTIRENCHVGWKEPFYEFNIDSKIFDEIYEKSNLHFKSASRQFHKSINKLYFSSGKDYFCDNLYSIEKQGAQDILSFKDLLCEFQEILEEGKSNLVKLIIDFGYLIDLISNYQLGAAQFKRNYLESAEMIFSIMERYLSSCNLWDEFRGGFLEFKQLYIRQRSILVSRILFNAIRKKSFDQKDQNLVIQEVMRLDEGLLGLISAINRLLREGRGAHLKS
jgi:hypothetical protein